MKFKVVGKSLILTDYSHKITKGENLFDTVEITVPNGHDDCDLSMLSFRFSEISEDGENSAVQVLRYIKCDEKYIYLKGAITSDFSAITGKVIFMLTGVNGENVVAKFQSAPYTISDDISLVSLPDTTAAEQLFNQTHLEVQKAMEAAERAEMASQTPAPAEIYPATTKQLGGIKSGGDISVSADGLVTVKSLNGKNPNDEIADIKSAQNSIASLSVQIAHPNNYLIYDDIGKPSVMVAIPKFYLDEVIDGASHAVHPAFIINGVEQDVIYISKYQNIVENGHAYSLPMKEPKDCITMSEAYDACRQKGKGWHLMTNAEWSAIALWCKKNGTIPKGNNDHGKDISEIVRCASPSSYISSEQIMHTATGSGPASWYHNADFSGIADLNGNVAERVSGLRLLNGEINIIPNNDAADTDNSQDANSSCWKSVLPDGTLSSPGANGSVKILKNDYLTNLSFSDTLSNDAKALLEAIAVIGSSNASAADYGNAYIYINNAEERICLRSNWFNSNWNAGIFAYRMDTQRGGSNHNIGFRAAYCEL
ncbi:MAG: hypothetical protein NC452_08900 [Eubacterium sp.]|nr:hypothetical protein [Eubacterium sp.]